MGYRYTVMDASVSIHMLLDHQPMASQYDAACFGPMSSGTIVTLDGVPGVVEYTAPGVATYTPVVQYAAASAAAAAPLSNGASNNSINGQLAAPAGAAPQATAPPPTAQAPPTPALPQQTAYLAAVTDPGTTAYFEPGIHYVLPATTCDSSPVHQGDSYLVATPASSSTASTADSFDPKSIQQGKNRLSASPMRASRNTACSHVCACILRNGSLAACFLFSVLQTRSQ